jgi:hypothetical protein|tara:strand:- start:244 stop:504 length:261 start_codon:yes stop_codon:yes gene_type:complete
MTKRKDKSNIIPFMDTAGKINFPGDEEQTETEAQLEAQQTADRIELEQRTEARALIADLVTTLQRRNIEPHIWCGELEELLNKFDF